jgi:hypothetical protein
MTGPNHPTDVHCPHCNGVLCIESVPPILERAFCGNCGLRSPAVLAGDAALNWVRNAHGATDAQSVGPIIRRAVVAWDREDPAGLAEAIESLRPFLRARRATGSPPATPPR